ncbi:MULTISPECIES: hypothetical protein [Streptomyces]|uniref:Uncharacterized protein n=1 Tax=Streptomyces bacillaris TaxID=68179 RepID=A0ABW6DQW1_9ACTN
MSSLHARLRVRLALALGAAEIHLRLRLNQLARAFTWRLRPRRTVLPFVELVQIESDPAYRALFFAQLDAALDERHTAAQTTVVEEIEAAAERLRALIRSPGRPPVAPSPEEIPVLQCTAVTRIPLDDTLTALITLPGEHPTPTPYALCELGEHPTPTDHAALLRPADNPDRPALWLFWTGTGTPDTPTHRIDTAPWCPATLHHLTNNATLPCSLFNRHPTGHSWDITDPLGDLIAGTLTTDDPQGRPHP